MLPFLPPDVPAVAPFAGTQAQLSQRRVEELVRELFVLGPPGKAARTLLRPALPLTLDEVVRWYEAQEAKRGPRENPHARP